MPADWQPSSRKPLPNAVSSVLLQRHIYGQLDHVPDIEIVDYEIVSETEYEGRATLAQWRLQIGFGADTRDFDLVALLPTNRLTAPIILSQNFCPNNAVIPLESVRVPIHIGFDCSGGGVTGILMKHVFGRYIVSPPLEDILDRGYGFAAVFPSQFVPDRGPNGLAVLDNLFPDQPNRPGALAVWSILFEVSAKVIESEFGERKMIAYGHSRFAKTALLAGAWSDHIDAVVAHQSGTLGASALDDGTGEPLDALIESYPHWVGLGIEPYKDNPEALPVRPADLLALIGPKPVLLGNARRDVWSDPWGAFTEAQSAWGSAFGAVSPSDFRPSDRKAYWLRPGTHGVVKEDWPAFLDFLDENIVQD